MGAHGRRRLQFSGGSGRECGERRGPLGGPGRCPARTRRAEPYVPHHAKIPRSPVEVPRLGLRTRWSSLSRPRRWLILLAAAVALWAVLGFLVAPPILRSQLETRLREATHRPASVEQ